MQAVFIDMFVFMPVTRHLSSKAFIMFWTVPKIRVHKRMQEEWKKKGREGNKRERGRVGGKRKMTTWWKSVREGKLILGGRTFLQWGPVSE